MKFFCLSLLSLLAFKIYSQATINNYSFERWSTQSGENMPVGWSCSPESVQNNAIIKGTDA